MTQGAKPVTGVIHVAAALTVDDRGHALMVRKHGTTVFMQPGGKIESGETPLEALRRELDEELGLRLPASAFTWIGTFEEDAANESGHRVLAEVFGLTVEREAPVARAEIAEFQWIDPANPGELDLAPLSVRALLPLLKGASDRAGGRGRGDRAWSDGPHHDRVAASATALPWAVAGECGPRSTSPRSRRRPASR